MVTPKLIKKKPLNYEFSDFLLTVPSSGKKTYDFKKIKDVFSQAGYNIFVILSERGLLGKTTQAKELTRKEFLKNGLPSVFIRNTETALNEERSNFLDPNTLNVNPFYRSCKMMGTYSTYKNKKWALFKYVNAKGKIKGSRPKVNNLFVDEINEDVNKVTGKYSTNIDSLINSFINPHDEKHNEDMSLWILANLKSINQPYFTAMGIVEIPDNPIIIYDQILINDKGEKIQCPYMVLICSTYTKEQEDAFIWANARKSWSLRLSLQTGEAHHSYFNKTLLDETLNVYQLGKYNNFNSRFYISVDNINFLQVYYYPYNPRFKYHVKFTPDNERDKNKQVIFFKKELVREGFFFSKKKIKIFEEFLRDKITFENSLSRMLLIDMMN